MDTNTNRQPSPGQAKREKFEDDIRFLEQQITIFNSHWLNHKHIMPAFAAVIMALIFLGMLVKSIELYLWAAVGGLCISFVCAMVWRTREADRLNNAMEVEQKAFKEYERSRRK